MFKFCCNAVGGVASWFGREMRNLRTVADANCALSRELFVGQRTLALIRLVVLIAIAVLPFVHNYLLGGVIGAVSGETDGRFVDRVGLAAALIAAVMLLAAMLPILNTWIDKEFEAWLFRFVDLRIATKIAGLDQGLYSSEDKHALFLRLREKSVWKILSFMRSQVPLFRAVSQVFLAALLLAHSDLMLLGAVVVAILPSFFLETRYSRATFDLDTRQTDKFRLFWHLRWYLTDSRSLFFLQGINAVSRMIESFNTVLVDLSREKVAHEREHLRWRLAALILAQAGIITVVVGLILRAVHGDMPASELVVTLAGIGLFSVGLADFSSLFGQQSAEGGHVLEFWSLDQITAWVQFPLVGRSPDISRGLEVSARNLCFGYGAEGAMNPVLKEVSFTIRAGSKTVLMAENGAGKSTLLSVIQRAFDITSGELKLGGVEIAEIAKETLRSLIGVLPQEFELFAVSAEEYIAMGCVGEPDQNRVRWAARMSGADRAKKCSA